MLLKLKKQLEVLKCSLCIILSQKDGTNFNHLMYYLIGHVLNLKLFILNNQ